jgi:hypothetical protein
MTHPLNLDQQKNLVDPRDVKSVTVIGAGSVGSWLALNLASVGCEDITVWDADDVESHNVPMSAYGLRDVGKLKVRALAELIEHKTGVHITTVERMYAGEPLAGSVAACVDWMDERKKIWERVRDNPNVDVFVDTRVSEEFVAVYGFNPCDPESMKHYDRLMYPSGEALRPMCGNHGIIYVAQNAANAACVCLTSHWSGGRKERHYRMHMGNLMQVIP